MIQRLFLSESVCICDNIRVVRALQFMLCAYNVFSLLPKRQCFDSPVTGAANTAAHAYTITKPTVIDILRTDYSSSHINCKSIEIQLVLSLLCAASRTRIYEQQYLRYIIFCVIRILIKTFWVIGSITWKVCLVFFCNLQQRINHARALPT